MGRVRGALTLDGGDFINRDLRGFWPLNDAAGMAQDLSLFRKHATGTTLPAREHGLLGKTPNWTGSQRFQSSTFVWPGGPEAAISVWLNVPGGVQTAAYDFGSQTLVSGNGFYAHLPWSDNRVYLYYGAVSSGEISASLSSYLNQWVHVAWSVSAGRKVIWINGKVANESGTVSAPVAALTNAYIGYAQQAALYHRGKMALFRVWSRALTDGEAKRLYSDPWAGTARIRLPIGPLGGTDYPLSADGITRQYAFGPATFPRGFPLTAEGLRRRYSFGDATLAFSGQVLGDTHDGFKRRSRRERALDAAAERQRQEWIAERNGLRLALEAAMGMAAEVVEDAPPAAVEAVQEAAQEARAVVQVLPALDAAALGQARAVVAQLQAAVEEAMRLRALAEDDEDVMMLLRAL